MLRIRLAASVCFIARLQFCLGNTSPLKDAMRPFLGGTKATFGTTFAGLVKPQVLDVDGVRERCLVATLEAVVQPS